VDTVKAVFVVFLGAYILLGEGPRWIGSGDESSAVHGPMQDGLRTWADPEERRPPRAARRESEAVHARGGWAADDCTGSFEVFAPGPGGSLHFAVWEPVSQRPGPPPARSASSASKKVAPDIDGCAPRSLHDVLPGRTPGDPAH